MLTLLFISSGLFLGWSLGANDAANIFGTAVGSRMVKFSRAAAIAGIFVILGAVIQGTGTTNTLSQLGSVDALGGAFTVALCSAVVVAVMTRFKLPVSTGQAIVGAIMGWCYFTSNPVDYKVLTVIVSSWVYGPVIGAVFSALLYMLMRRFIKRTKIHLLKLDAIIRISLLLVGAFGAYSLGANNIANVMGVFVNTMHFSINIGTLSIDSVTLLFLLGGLAIAAGVITYSKKVMETIGTGILAMTPESAIVVVLAQSLVLFIFSSTSLSEFIQSLGLPGIPMVPVSSTQVVVGALLGVGLVKGVQEIKFKILGSIVAGWIATPILSGVASFFSLFFMQSVFGLTVTRTEVNQPSGLVSNSSYIPQINISSGTTNVIISVLLFISLLTTLVLLYFYLKSRVRLIEKEKKWTELVNFSDMQKALSDMEVNTIQMENNALVSRLEERRKELITYSLNIGEQRQILSSICKSLESAITAQGDKDKNELIQAEINKIRQKMSFTDEVELIYSKAEQVYTDFAERLAVKYPNLTAQEKRLVVLLRIGFSSKEIAPILNISPKSVEISRFRLRKRLNLNKDDNLTEFIKNM
jgi:phosphate/sulfate permease/DNA-binding NarL/FixJ family response regulator